MLSKSFLDSSLTWLAIYKEGRITVPPSKKTPSLNFVIIFSNFQLLTVYCRHRLCAVISAVVKSQSEPGPCARCVMLWGELGTFFGTRTQAIPATSSESCALKSTEPRNLLSVPAPKYMEGWIERDLGVLGLSDQAQAPFHSSMKTNPLNFFTFSATLSNVMLSCRCNVVIQKELRLALCW